MKAASLPRLKAVYREVHANPSILVIPLLLFSIVLSLGVWGVHTGATRDTAAARIAAQSRLDGVAQTLELTFARAILPVRQLAGLIQHIPNYQTLMGMWDSWIPPWWSLGPANKATAFVMAPFGRIAATYPHTPENKAILTLDTLADPRSSQAILAAIMAGRTTMLGVTKSPTDGQSALTLLDPVFIRNVSADESWSIPGGEPTNCPPGLCYNATTRTKWWGHVVLGLLVDEVMKDSSGHFLLDPLALDNAEYRLLSPVFGSPHLTTSLYESTDKAMTSDSLCREVPVVEDKWQLCVWKASWRPAYLVPLVVVLVLVALALSAATFAVLLSRHEHRALLHSLLPKEAIQKLQAEFHWENHDGAQQGMVGSGTPAEIILSFTQDILLGRLPDLPKVMAVRHALQQSLDVYQPLQADLTQRMAETENMDVEVRDALMLQLVGRRAEAEAEEERDQMSVPAESGCYASTDVNVHTLLTVSEEESLPATLAAASPPATKQAGGTASFTSSAAATVSAALRPIGCRRTAAGPPSQCEVQAAGSHNLPVVKDPVGPVEGQEVQAADRHILPVCIRDQARPCLQPSPVLTNNGTEATVETAAAAAAAAAAASVSLHRLPSITKRPSMPADDGHGIDPRSRPPTVISMLEHIMSQMQPEAPPPGSGTALLLLQPTPLLAGAGAGLAHLSQPAGHEPDGVATTLVAAARPPLSLQMACGKGTADGSGDEISKCSGGSVPLHPLPGPCLGIAFPGAQMPLVDSCLSSANSWAFDAFQLTSATAGRPLSVLAYWLLHQSGLAAWAHLDHTKLARWLCRIEDGYCANPYHNRSHAADVVQTIHMLLTRGGLMPGYADHLTQLAAYLAAVCHDYQHIGRTNDWLVETQDELALRYNDRSPMENHHLAGAFSLLKHPDMNFLQAMPKATYDRLRKLVIELVLGTDMKQHFSIIGQFTALHRTGGDGQATGRKVSQPGQATELHMGSIAQPIAKEASRESSMRSLHAQPASEQDKLLGMQMALKCSDLGHLAAPLPVHLAWVSRLEAEFFAQGDAERAQGLTISPLCDRTKQGITKSQVGFFEFVALPLFTNFTARFTAAKPLLRGVMANYHHWQAQAAVAAEPQAPAQGG